MIALLVEKSGRKWLILSFSGFEGHYQRQLTQTQCFVASQISRLMQKGGYLCQPSIVMPLRKARMGK